MSEIVRSESVYADMMQNLLCYAQAFVENYIVRFVDVIIMVIAEYMMCSSFLAANFRATNIRHITVQR